MADFDTACLDAAKSFLQTVVLLDDRAAFATPDGGLSDEGDLGADATLNDPDADDEPLVPAAPEPAAAPLAKAAEQSLNAGLITRGFAAKGLVCAVLRPQPTDDLQKETLIAASRADIVVLDWEMEDRGEKATEIVKHLHAEDKKGGGRLRLITIYTGHSPLANVYGALKSSLAGFDKPADMKDGDLTLEGPDKITRIVILSKSASVNAPKERHLAVGEADLPDRIVKEFAKFAGGLLPNATMASIAALRNHTHRMLARLDKSLDGPLITHNILVGDAGDPDEFLATVIMEEMESQVPLRQIARQFSGRDSIAAYFEHWMNMGLTPRMPLEKEIGASKGDLTLDEIRGLISSGLPGLRTKTDAIKAPMTASDIVAYDTVMKQSLHKRLYFLTGDNDAQKRSEHERFAHITGMRRDGSTVKKDDPETYPVLKLGSVLRCDATYWVCITPICDCVRIADAGGSFLLIRLTKASSEWTVIVEADKKLVKLEVDKKRQFIQSVFFGPASAGLVRSIFDAEKPLFREVVPSPTSGSSYEWLGEMKPMQAQRIVQNLANNIARIGLDEFEWQRLHAPRT